MSIFPNHTLPERLQPTPEDRMGYWASAHIGNKGPGIYLGVSTGYKEIDVGIGVGMESYSIAGSAFVQQESEYFRSRVELNLSRTEGFLYGASLGIPWHFGDDLVMETNANLRWKGSAFDSFRFGLRLEWPLDYETTSQ